MAEDNGFINKIFKVLQTFVVIFGGIAAIVACAITFLAFVAPQQTRQVVIQLVSGGAPTPVVVTVVVRPTPPSGTPTLLPLPTATYTPYPTYTSYPTYTPYPSPSLPSSTPLPPTATVTKKPTPTNTPVGHVNEVHEVSGSGSGRWYQTGVYIQAGDQVSINYISGEWWIGQRVNRKWIAQTPTGADGYVGREGDRVASLLTHELTTKTVDRCRLLVSAPFGSLIGRIGESGAMFLIGNSLEFVAQDNGTLLMRINYNNHNAVTNCPYGDGGAISVRVVVIPP